MRQPVRFFSNSGFCRSDFFRGAVDTLVFRSTTRRSTWIRICTPGIIFTPSREEFQMESRTVNFFKWAFPASLWIYFFLFLVPLLDCNWWVLQWVNEDWKQERRRKSLHHFSKLYFKNYSQKWYPTIKITVRIGWQQFWSEKSLSLSRDSKPACQDRIMLLYHLRHHYCHKQYPEW